MPDADPTPDTVESLDAELERRIAELSLLENQGEGLRRADLALLIALTVVAPIVLLIVGWFL
ncbi:hypothetical protein PV379_27930 [Streptomyces caniscabiei]|uniref:hypothetical protein n=1 Tax=Streptomyces caniscabiei TaxID=2746961 RepID=UPI0029B63CAE|nr:hypothetical protein [Streptomyces caniscabiei]MDX2604456.1 hypothetical protein [Streptomyces caniscabiei]MDX2735798.1 hypothetical protein [Streptomyces caniscabiei]MDX2781101.1 hypothetical protein [Streptomyces caniscabiei]